MSNPILGPEYEIGQIQDELECSKAEKIPVCIRVAGPSGIGKSTSLRALGQRQPATGGSPHSRAATRSSAPSVGKRTACAVDPRRAWCRARPVRLGNRIPARPAGRIRRGVSSAHRRRLARFALSLLLDDVQWLDAESRMLIDRTMRSFLDRSIALLVEGRTGAESGPQWLKPDVSVSVGALPRIVAGELVRAHYPRADAALIEAILEQSLTHPIRPCHPPQAARENGIVAARELTASVRAVVARWSRGGRAVA